MKSPQLSGIPLLCRCRRRGFETQDCSESRAAGRVLTSPCGMQIAGSRDDGSVIAASVCTWYRSASMTTHGRGLLYAASTRLPPMRDSLKMIISASTCARARHQASLCSMVQLAIDLSSYSLTRWLEGGGRPL